MNWRRKTRNIEKRKIGKDKESEIQQMVWVDEGGRDSRLFEERMGRE